MHECVWALYCLFSLTQLSSTMPGEAKETITQLSSLKAIAEQAVVQANLFPSSKKLPEDSEALRSKYINYMAQYLNV